MEIIIRQEKSASIAFFFVHFLVENSWVCVDFLDENACILVHFYEYLEDSGDMY